MHCLASRFQALCLLLLLVGTGVLQAQWRPLNKPFSTSISYLAEHDGTVLASSPTGIYRSTDEGLNWTHVFAEKYTQDIVRAGNDFFAASVTGVVVSHDDGRTWAHVPHDFSGGISALAFDGSTLYACSFGAPGIFTSTDNGATWTVSSEGLPNTYVIAFAVMGTDVYLSLNNGFGDENGGIFARNTDGSWRRAGLEGRSMQAFAAVSTSLFAGDWEGLYRSTDKGATWQLLSTPPGAVFTSIVAMGTTLYGGAQGVLRSVDNGDTWTSVGMELMNVQSLEVRGTSLIAGTMLHGAYISDDGGATWQPVNDGIKSTAPVSALTADGKDLYAVVQNTNTLYKGVGGTAWSALPTPVTTASITTLAVINSTLLAGTGLGGIFNSDVNGASWQMSTGLPGQMWTNSFLRSGSTILAGTYGISMPAQTFSGVYISNDIGLTWTPSDLLSATYCLAQHNGALYAGTERDGVFMSTDGGAHWTRTSENLPNNSSIYALASNGSTLFASAYNEGVFASHDNGTTWQQAMGGMFGITRATSFAVSGSAVFAATDLGIFRTQDNGLSWESIAEGMENLPVQVLTISDGYLYAGTIDEAVWRRPLSEITTTSVQESTPEPLRYSLQPHPLTSTSLLQLCSTCELHNATLSLSTVGGQRVLTTTGLHGTSVSIERGSMAAGVYTFTLEEAGRVVASGTLVVE